MPDKDNWHNRLNQWIKDSHKKPWTRSLKDKEWRTAERKIICRAHKNKIEKLWTEDYYQVSN